MVRAIKGVLLTCDPAVKQLILSLNDNNKPNSNSVSEFGLVPPFIIQDLDETHILVTQECVPAMRRQLEAELEKNTFTIEAFKFIANQVTSVRTCITTALSTLSTLESLLWNSACFE
ncbi:hypothetical protein O181_000505 [Austropuccinia psidii MF-1]|uniref:General transcription and DNA repair factor IIH subunit TFB5 n=1 Tax=Austropuccinia psidii MF-1 TaxID=1389203 RepID=A0A9Q3B905_9BASI|nr:hypothetical protein [Austropuccinia psidii MF-1]